jgi:hypothetical protein
MIEPVVRALLWSEFGITNTGAPMHQFRAIDPSALKGVT